jgi:hypothetical protein
LFKEIKKGGDWGIEEGTLVERRTWRLFHSDL